LFWCYLHNLLRSLSCVPGEGQLTTEYVEPRLLNPQCKPFICHLSAGSWSTVQFKWLLLHFLKILFIVFQTFLNLRSLNKSILLWMNPSTSAQICATCHVLQCIIIFKFVYLISVFKVLKIFLTEICYNVWGILYTTSAYKFGVYCMYCILFPPFFKGN
jgi:hypothetical protein